MVVVANVVVAVVVCNYRYCRQSAFAKQANALQRLCCRFEKGVLLQQWQSPQLYSCFFNKAVSTKQQLRNKLYSLRHVLLKSARIDKSMRICCDTGAKNDDSNNDNNSNNSSNSDNDATAPAAATTTPPPPPTTTTMATSTAKPTAM